MLLQGSPSAQRPNPVRHEPAESRPHQHRAVVPEPAAAPARGRAYPPITWDHPSMGKVVAEGLGGISKTTLQLLLTGAALIGSAVAIALVITSIVSAFGINASARY